MAKLRVAVEQQEPVGRRVGPRVAHVLYDPKGSRISRDAATKNLAPVVRDDEEAVQDTEGERRNGEEVHGGNGFTMVS